SWVAVARQHPALQLLRGAGARPRADVLVPAARALGNVLTWTDVHHQCAERGWLNDRFPPRSAAWMDEGMLAPWLLGSSPALAESAAGARTVVVPAAERAMLAALAELGFDAGAAA